MANQQHLALLKQGVEAWNQWRADNPEIKPDLSLAFRENLNVRQVFFTETQELFVTSTDQSGVLHPAELLSSKADLRRASNGRLDLRGANLNEAKLDEANLILADLRGATLIGAQLTGALPMGANLGRANLNGANLAGADVRWANLVGADLENAELSFANFTGADLRRVDLDFAYINRTEFSGANLSRAIIGGTSFSDVDLSQVKGLELVVHDFPSSISVDTLAQTLRGSGGRFTLEQMHFFESAGVPHTLLEYLPYILETEPLQFYQCFISYSTRDEEFAERLNRDLNNSGVKTWKWDRDAVRGRDLRQNIDQAIRSHDKTILICSVNSLTSPQVEWEIETALEKESRLKNAASERAKEALAAGEKPPYVDTDVLFPIRLDNTVFNWDSHLAHEVRRRMISDFTDAPPGSDKYRRELQKLINALDPRAWPPRQAQVKLGP